MDFILSHVSQYLPILNSVLQVLGGLVIAATAVVRIFPGNAKLGEAVGQGSDVWSKIVLFLPTIGINPQTQKIQDAINDQKPK